MFHTRNYDGGPKHIEKVESMDGHEVKCILTIYPPSGQGYGGAVPWNFIQVYLDGELVLNSPFGYYHQSGSTIFIPDYSAHRFPVGPTLKFK